MLLLIDKPKGITSHDVINVVRRVMNERRVGHAGTLDPNATGLLIVAVGREDTKKLGDLTKNTNKTYIAEITLGEQRDTDDIEGEVLKTDKNLKEISFDEINEALKTFLGEQEQIPPIYSAIKLNGKKAYELARKGTSFELKPRRITVFNANVVSYLFPVLSVEFEVSSGTYIRSLARDLGVKLGTFAFLSELRRTRIGEYTVEKAISLETLQKKSNIL